MTNHAAANISIFQIQLFLSVAKHRSFSVAAVENNIEQSNLSRQISRLEDYLNVSLFIRSSHPIRLTKEGEILYRLWEPLMESFDFSINALEKSANRLTICMSDSISMIHDIHSLREFVAKKKTEFNLQFLFCPVAEYMDYLLKGEADAAITIYNDEIPKSDLVEYYKIKDCLMTVSMLKTNPLSQKGQVTLGDLADQDIIVFESKNNTFAFDNLTSEIKKNYGYSPRIIQTTSSVMGMPNLLQKDNQVIIGSDCYNCMPDPKISTFRFRGPYPLSLYAIRCKENRIHPMFRQIIDWIREFYTEKEQLDS